MKHLLMTLSRMPHRQQYLVVGCILLSVSILLFMTAKVPVMAWQVARDERLRLHSTQSGDATLQQIGVQLDRGIVQLNARPDVVAARMSTNTIAVDLVETLNRLSLRRNVSLNSVLPVARRQVFMFEQLPFDLEASGMYADLVAWLQDVEGALPNAGITTLTARPGAEGRVILQMRIVAYRFHEMEKK